MLETGSGFKNSSAIFYKPILLRDKSNPRRLTSSTEG
jgi:hypothetical protein